MKRPIRIQRQNSLQVLFDLFYHDDLLDIVELYFQAVRCQIMSKRGKDLDNGFYLVYINLLN